MKSLVFKPATHLSIIWGVTLAVMTIIEWNSLDRNPVKQEILSPFIERHVDVTLENATTTAESADDIFEPEESPDAKLRYDVELKFNGPLFLACFFVPVLIFHGAGQLWQRLRQT